MCRENDMKNKARTSSFIQFLFILCLKTPIVFFNLRHRFEMCKIISKKRNNIIITKFKFIK